jgi:hypothetical protein
VRADAVAQRQVDAGASDHHLSDCTLELDRWNRTRVVESRGHVDGIQRPDAGGMSPITLIGAFGRPVACAVRSPTAQFCGGSYLSPMASSNSLS